MSYDPDSVEAKKGALGEEIVKKYLKDLGAIVTRPDEYGEKTLVDFLAVPKDGSAFVARYVEVKVRSAFPYAHGQYLCYAFPAVQINAYKKFAADKTLPVQLWIVDPSVGKIFISNLSSEKNSLEAKHYIDCKEFPFDQETKFGLMHYYHQKQFSTVYDIDKANLKRLQNIDCNKPTISDENLTREAFIKVNDILIAPNGINIDIITVAGDSCFFVKAARVSSAIGYQNPSITASAPIIKAADRLQVKYYRFPTQRLSGGDSYGSKAYYFAIEDVPKVLAQYCEIHYKAKPATRQGRYNLAAQKLREWFQSTVLAHYMNLSDAISNSGDKELYDCWFNEGFHTVDRYSKDFSVAYSFILEHLGFDLPNEWARLEQQLDALIQSLSTKPMWIIHKVGWQISKLSYNQRTKQLAEQISEKTWEIRRERPKPYPKITKVIAVDNLAKKIGELQTPNGTTLEFFAVEDCDKIFVHGAQLAVAAGYLKQAGATSDNTDFSKSINAVAQFYGIRRSKGGKARRFVNIEDVPAILNEFAFNQTLDKEQYATATALLHWWFENSNIIDGIKQ